MRISDWSSDVCSSDLVGERVNDVPQHMASAWGVKTVPLQEDMALRVGAGVRYIGNTVSTGPTTVLKTPGYTLVDALVALDWNRWKIGRASCRERVCQYV